MNILLSRTDSIGDVVLTLPMAGFIKAKFPNSTVHFLGKSYTKDVIAMSKFVDSFWDWNKISQQSERDQVIWMKELNLDEIVHVFPNKEVARLAKKANIKSRVGTSHRLFHWLYCNIRPNFTRKKSTFHEAQLNINLLPELKEKTLPDFKIIEECYGFSAPIIKEEEKNYLDLNKFNLILHPKSKGSAVEWGVEKFIELANSLPKDQFQVLFSGTEEEGQMFRNQLPNDVVDLSGKMTLNEFITIIANCDGLLAASTGPLHIASALGKHAMGIYSPQRPIHPGRWAPIGKQAKVFVKETSENIFYRGGNCPFVQQITVEEVKEYLLSIV